MLLGTEIWQYSVSEQKVVNRYGGLGSIDCFAADENYIFFVVNASSKFAVEGEMWRVDRKTGEWYIFYRMV